MNWFINLCLLSLKYGGWFKWCNVIIILYKHYKSSFEWTFHYIVINIYINIYSITYLYCISITYNAHRSTTFNTNLRLYILYTRISIKQHIYTYAHSTLHSQFQQLLYIFYQRYKHFLFKTNCFYIYLDYCSIVETIGKLNRFDTNFTKISNRQYNCKRDTLWAISALEHRQDAIDQYNTLD